MTCREIPLFQKTCWTNCSKGTNSKYSCEEETRRGFTQDYTRQPPCIHPSHEINNIHFMKVHASVSNTEKTKYSHLDLETLNDYVATKYASTHKKRTEKSIWYTVFRDWDVICNSLEEEENTKAHRERKKNVHKVSHKCIYSIFKFQ